MGRGSRPKECANGVEGCNGHRCRTCYISKHGTGEERAMLREEERQRAMRPVVSSGGVRSALREIGVAFGLFGAVHGAASSGASAALPGQYDDTGRYAENLKSYSRQVEKDGISRGLEDG